MWWKGGKLTAVATPGSADVFIVTVPTPFQEEHRPDLSFPATHGERSDIRIAHCPERVLPGRILEEVVEDDRVIGGLTRRCSSEAAQLYRKVIRGQCHLTSARTAEMVKLTENAYRGVNIAFANELSLICDRLTRKLKGFD